MDDGTRGIRRDALTFTRFLAALPIVIFHFGSEVFPFNAEPLKTLIQGASVGVSYFFVLSGFIMIIAYAHKEEINPFEYYRSRAARVLAGYFFALALFLPTLIRHPETLDVSGLMLNVALLQAWVPTKALSINGPGWSLSVEVLFYLLFPFLFSFYKKVSISIIIAIGGLLFLVTQVLLNYTLSSADYTGYPSFAHGLMHYSPPMHLNEFIIGNISGMIYLRFFSKTRRKNGPLILLTNMLILLLVFFPIGLSRHNGLLAIVFVPLILLLSTDEGVFCRVLSKRSFVFLGEISFAVYILQQPIFSICEKIRGVLHNYLALDVKDGVFFFIYLLGLLASSMLVYLFIESPARKAINSIPIRKFSP